jgi:hypothetical protein
VQQVEGLDLALVAVLLAPDGLVDAVVEVEGLEVPEFGLGGGAAL